MFAECRGTVLDGQIDHFVLALLANFNHQQINATRFAIIDGYVACNDTMLRYQAAAQIPSGLATPVVVIRVNVQVVNLHIIGLKALAERCPGELKSNLDDGIVRLQAIIFTNDHWLFQFWNHGQYWASRYHVFRQTDTNRVNVSATYL